jgi:hypothetical protein
VICSARLGSTAGAVGDCIGAVCTVGAVRFLKSKLDERATASPGAHDVEKAKRDEEERHKREAEQKAKQEEEERMKTFNLQLTTVRPYA